MANRDVIAVIKADELCQQDPDREQDERPEGVRGGRRDDDAGGRGGDDVRQREHAAAQGITPRSVVKQVRELIDGVVDSQSDKAKLKDLTSSAEVEALSGVLDTCSLLALSQRESFLSTPRQAGVAA